MSDERPDLPDWLVLRDWADLQRPRVPSLQVEAPTKPTASDRFRDFIDNVAIMTVGKRFGILGQRAAGKTTLHDWLRDGELRSEYRPTLGVELKRKARRIIGESGSDQGGVRLNLKQGRDVPGDRRSNFEAWRQVVRESHYLLYLFDAHRLVDGDEQHRREVASDCSVVGQIIFDLHGEMGGPKIVLVGTHCDLIPGYVPPTEQFLEFTNGVSGLQAIKDAQHYLRESRQGALKPPVVLGALNDATNAEDLAVRLMTALGV